ncbi:MAG: Asp-tRNA(Asn)/Glu-tRNA(Gln) amidotransferase subunit GatB [Planctomycetota bacterium]
MDADARQRVGIERVELTVGLEVHIELSCARKVFAPSANPAALIPVGGADGEERGPNVLTDPVVLGLPGALPVLNRAAVEQSVLVGLALGCEIARVTKWDRKSYFYPDLPKAYQISQYDEPVCGAGEVLVPRLTDKGAFDFESERRRVRICRAHLEEDAGKLVHEGVGAGSGVDLNRAGAPLLEIVTEPDFVDAEGVVAFGQMLRGICRWLGVSLGVMQRGHMRFEPNINCTLTLESGKTVSTPIVEIKNLNSFRSVRAAVEYEFSEQPERWREDGREFALGTKTTRGWDDEQLVSFLQREKEEAADYRYFPDPDLPSVVIDPAWVEAQREAMPVLPLEAARMLVAERGLRVEEALALIEERGVYDLFVRASEASGGADRSVANLLLQIGSRLANERAVGIHELGLDPGVLGSLAKLREDGDLDKSGAEELFVALVAGEIGGDVRAAAEARGLLAVRDEDALLGWCDEAIGALPDMAQQVRDGNDKAIGRLIGEVRKRSGGSADAKRVRELLIERLRGG